jgi:hypothetical protein
MFAGRRWLKRVVPEAMRDVIHVLPHLRARTELIGFRALAVYIWLQYLRLRQLRHRERARTRNIHPRLIKLRPGSLGDYPFFVRPRTSDVSVFGKRSYHAARSRLLIWMIVVVSSTLGPIPLGRDPDRDSEVRARC